KLERIGGPAYLAELSDAVGTARGIEYSCKAILEKSRLRQIIEAGQRAEKMAMANDADSLEVLGQVDEAFTKIRESSSNGQKPYVSASQLIKTDFTQETPVVGKGILPDGGGLIIAGESGVGKSMLRLEMAVKLALGYELWGLPVPKPRKVFILQFENPLGIEKARLSRMVSGLNLQGVPKELLFSDPTIRIDLGLKRDWTRLLNLVKDTGADVVVYDPLTSLHSVNENDNVDIRKVLDTITEINRKCGTSAIVIHHFGKPNPELSNAYRARGASSIKDWCDSMASLTHKSHGHKTLRLLEFHKVRCGPGHRPILLERDEKFLHHKTEEDTLCSVEKVEEILKGLGGEVDCQKDLITEVCKVTGCGDRTARSAVNEAVKLNLIRRVQGEKGNRSGYVSANIE
ncbi:MAG: AAA family ATPase, partial [Deltaproteobacteria bacterium]|nr:AAA family ATPase [Deltaproteobacteria bacterium]